MVRKWLIVVFVAIGFVYLTGCKKTIDDDMIKRGHLEYMHGQGKTDLKLDDIEILENYGTYAECIVVRINREAYQVITEIELGVDFFTFSDSNIALVWCDGQFNELKDAYEEGLLTKSDLESLAKKVNKS